MPFLAFGGGASGPLLSKCSSTLFCFLRTVPLWIVVIVVLLAGALRQFVCRSASSSSPTSRVRARARAGSAPTTPREQEGCHTTETGEKTIK